MIEGLPPGKVDLATGLGHLLVVGAGRMGGALIRGWLAGGLPPERLHVVDPHLDAAASQQYRSLGISLEQPSQPPDVLVLAIKPQVFASAAAELASAAGPETMVLSILAGRTLASLRAGLPAAAHIVRAMPNLPAAIGRGASAVASEQALAPAERMLVEALLGAVGLVEWVDEAQLDAVTAVSGSGPAYVFAFVESLAEAGIAAGLPADVAGRLARATVEGAGALLAQEPTRTAADLREAVTSPGGTTAAALAVLQSEPGLTTLVRGAVAAAAKRAGELAG